MDTGKRYIYVLRKRVQNSRPVRGGLYRTTYVSQKRARHGMTRTCGCSCSVKCSAGSAPQQREYKDSLQQSPVHALMGDNDNGNCNTLQHTTTHCNTLQHTATHCNTRQHTATHCNTRQHTATHCNTLQHTATHCNTLQHTATHGWIGLHISITRYSTHATRTAEYTGLFAKEPYSKCGEATVRRIDHFCCLFDRI